MSKESLHSRIKNFCSRASKIVGENINEYIYDTNILLPIHIVMLHVLIVYVTKADDKSTLSQQQWTFNPKMQCSK